MVSLGTSDTEVRIPRNGVLGACISYPSNVDKRAVRIVATQFQPPPEAEAS
jgi:hypothetical protein